MEAPDDDIVVGKNKVNVDLFDHHQNIKLFEFLRKMELISFVFILILFVLNFFKIPFFLDLVYYLNYDEYERHIMRYINYGSFANFGYFIILVFCSYKSLQIFRKLASEEQNKAGTTFYVFQTLKLFVYLMQYLNFTYVLASFTIFKMILTYQKTNPKKIKT